MLFTIRHHTRYDYSNPVRLGPQALRFHPRDDGAQRVIEHRLDVTPVPCGVNAHIDLEGNRVNQLWFDGETTRLDISLLMQVETLRENPFDFILAPEAARLPIVHAPNEPCARAYLERILPDDAVTRVARAAAEIARGLTAGASTQPIVRLLLEPWAPVLATV